MAESIEQEKRRKKRITRIMALFLIYVMIIGVAAGVTAGTGSKNWVVPTVVIVAITVIYWMGFFIVIRRQTQKENLKAKKEAKRFEEK